MFGQRAKVDFTRLFAALQCGVDQRRDTLCCQVLDMESANQFQRINFRILDLLIKRVPIGDFFAVWHTDHQDRQARLAEEHVLDQIGVRLDVSVRGHGSVSRPKMIPIDKKVFVPGVFTVF